MKFALIQRQGLSLKNKTNLER